LGVGKYWRIFWPTGLICPVGIRLPEYGTPVAGSLTTIRFPFESRLFEKSPMRSAAVGIVLF